MGDPIVLTGASVLEIREQALALRAGTVGVCAGVLYRAGFPPAAAWMFAQLLAELAVRHTPFSVRIREQW